MGYPEDMEYECDDWSYDVAEQEIEEGYDSFRESRFIDHASASADLLDDLLRTYLPLDIDWSIGKGSCTLRFPESEVQVTNRDGLAVTATSGTIPRRWLDPLRVALRDILKQSVQEVSWSTLSFGIVILQLGEEAAWHIQEFQKHEEWRARHGRELKVGWDATSSNWRTTLEDPNSLGVNLATVNDTAKFLLGETITDILKQVPKDLRVLHVEPVFRNDLVARFIRKRQEIKGKLMEMDLRALRKCVSSRELQNGGVQNTAEGIAEYLSTPHVTFHGAPRNVISSIVRYGFVIPGKKIGDTGEELDIACGASYGIGTYSSPSIEFASSYARDYGGLRHPADVPGLRMIVCAVLMGRSLEITRAVARRTEGLYRATADSHVSPNKMEYIVFDTAQIVPCYVLHLDYGAEAARKHFDLYMNDPIAHEREKSRKSRLDMPSYGQTADDPGARQARKEALKAHAAKWFPYGYGPATGTSFVIEEIGEVSDDEEEYGDYQELRQDEKEEEYGIKRSAEEKGSWFDEFQTVRTTKKEVRVKRD